MTSLLSSLFRRSEKRHTYTELMRLDDRMLRDIGLTRTDLHQMMFSRGSRDRRFPSHE